MTAQKIPGWGLLCPQETRAGPDGQTEFFVCPEGHAAPFWAGLEEISRHKGRIIYQEVFSEGSD